MVIVLVGLRVMVAGAISIVFRSIDVATTVTITIVTVTSTVAINFVLLNIMDGTAVRRRSGGGVWCLAVPAVIVFSLCVIVFSLCVISTLGVGGVRG